MRLAILQSTSLLAVLSWVGPFAGVTEILGSSPSTSPTFTNSFDLPGTAGGSIAVADFDNDGYLDILLTGQTNIADRTANITQLWRNLGNGTFSNVNAELPRLYQGSVAWGDFDKDGYLDILLLGKGDTGMVCQVWQNLGNGKFRDINAGLPGLYQGSVAWGDFDNDGYPDILLTGSDGVFGHFTELWRNLGNGTFTNINAGLPELFQGKVLWADFDNDGYLDMLLEGQSASEFVSPIWRNLGNGTFTNVSSGLPGLETVALADFDNDGYVDVLMAGYSATGITSQVWRNLGNGTFTNTHAMLPGVHYGAAVCADFDNDGKVDILLTGIASDWLSVTSQICRNLGDGTFTNAEELLPGTASSALAAGDFDNDGKLDIVLAGGAVSGFISEVWRNTSPATNDRPSQPGNLRTTQTGIAVLLSWSPSQDLETPAAALTYNLAVGSSSGHYDIISPEAESLGGFHRLPEFGNMEHRLSFTVSNLVVGRTYYWTVQGIDNGFAPSPFAREVAFSVGPLLTGFNLQKDGLFRFQFDVQSRTNYTVQASTDLLKWVDLSSFSFGGTGPLSFIDPEATNYSARFYRIGQR